MDTKVVVEFCFFDKDAALLPADATPWPPFPDLALVPQKDDTLFMGPRSAWSVMGRSFQQLAPDVLQVQLWLRHAPELLDVRPRPRPVLVQG